MTLGELYLEAKKHNQLELEVLIHFLISNKHQSFQDDASELNKYFVERHKEKMNAIIHDELKTRSRPFKTYLIDDKIIARSQTLTDLQYSLSKHNVKYTEINITDDDFYKETYTEDDGGNFRIKSKKISLPNKLTLLGYIK